MPTLTALLDDYLTTRRSLGAILGKNERYVRQYLDYLADHDQDTITTTTAIAWATLPNGNPGYLAQRYSAVHLFSRWAHSFDDRHDSLPDTLHTSTTRHRLTPYIYADTQIQALMNLTNELHTPIRKRTLRTLIGLLAATGLRVGEALNLHRNDYQPGLLTITDTKFNKSRLVPLHPTVDDALIDYAHARDDYFPNSTTNTFFVSSVNTALEYKNVHYTFHRLTTAAGITAPSQHCRPRIHDLRHTFAINTLRDAYRTGADPTEILPILSTYLGHVDPTSTYWYLHATPELLAAAATRIPPMTSQESP